MKNKKQSLTFFLLFSLGTVILTLLMILVVFEILLSVLPQDVKYSSASFAIIAGIVLSGFITRTLAKTIIKKKHLETQLDENIINLFIKKDE